MTTISRAEYRRQRYQQNPQVRARRIECDRQRYQKPQVRARKADYTRQRSTGMPPEIYHQLLIDQAGLCAICDKQMTGRGACADHDHNNPGVYRGLLCAGCNHDIAILENPELFPRAQAYLAEHTYTGLDITKSINLIF
jgi:hypothetical protein